MRFFLLFSFSLFSFLLKGQISGSVIDENNNPLIGALITLLPDSTQAVTNAEGVFSIQSNNSKNIELRTSYFGYITDTIYIETLTTSNQNLKIKLVPDNTILTTVVVTEEHAKLEATLQTEHIYESFIHKNLEGNFAQTLEKLPGISAINTGVGIAKPVIRGLNSNRIIVNHQGIKQENQQWGSDHGLAIDQFDVDRVEIIKGPGSLQYGSDGLGGVINILPDVILTTNSYEGNVIGIYKSNNDHFGGSAKFGINLKDWFLSARYSQQDFADYQVPANTFTYNGFDLPILNNRLKNTAGNESSFSLSTGIKRKWGVTRLLYSHYYLNAGLFSGAVGVPRAYALTDDFNNRDIDVPQQKVNHYRLSLNQSFFLGEDHLVFDIGIQRNLRQEFSEPEFHSIPLSQLEDPNDKLALQLLLNTFSIDSHYEKHVNDKMKSIFGINTQWQDNDRDGFEYLLPEFNTFRAGIYAILENNINEKMLVNGGVRFDVGQNRSVYTRQYIWNSNEIIIDSLVSPVTDDFFLNWSASLGTNYVMKDGKWVLKVNLGKSFRVPYPSETVSNGIHHGTFRHEVGTPDLKSEQGYQFDVGLNCNLNRFKGNLSMYFNYFDNYIYLGPTFPAQFSTLPEAGQIFQYRQDDAIYSGFELQWDWRLSDLFALEQAVDFVQSFNPVTGLALPFTPQPSIRTDFNILPQDFLFLSEMYVEISHEFHLAAAGLSRIDRSEVETPAYQLWGLKMGSHFTFGQQDIEVRAQIQNAFNTRYLSHLSRYRILNIPEQGRNFILTINIPFRGGLN